MTEHLNKLMMRFYEIAQTGSDEDKTLYIFASLELKALDSALKGKQ